VEIHDGVCKEGTKKISLHHRTLVRVDRLDAVCKEGTAGNGSFTLLVILPTTDETPKGVHAKDTGIAMSCSFLEPWQ